MELDHMKNLRLEPGIQGRISKYITQFSFDVIIDQNFEEIIEYYFVYYWLFIITCLSWDHRANLSKADVLMDLDYLLWSIRKL